MRARVLYGYSNPRLEWRVAGAGWWPRSEQGSSALEAVAFLVCFVVLFVFVCVHGFFLLLLLVSLPTPCCAADVDVLCCVSSLLMCHCSVSCQQCFSLFLCVYVLT